MGNNVRVSTDEVRSVASKIRSLNTNLDEQLEQCKQTVDGLSSIWEGEASEETRSSFTSFINKYRENYKQVIDDYARFLEEVVAAGYEEAETKNKNLAEAFK